MNDNVPASLPDWAYGMNCAVTVADADCNIIYMNERSRQTFAARGGADLIGHNLMDYHNERSRAIIRDLLATEAPTATPSRKADCASSSIRPPGATPAAR